MINTPIKRFDIEPNYSKGFSFSWIISEGLADNGPWKFYIERSQAPNGPWELISPEIVNQYRWDDNRKVLLNKNEILHFRLTMVTPVKMYYSAIIKPYGDLNSKEFYIASDIMRREILHLKNMAGTEGQLYLISTFGPKCTKCIDPINGHVRDSSCPKCFGTGRDPAYNGPYNVWLSFSPIIRTTQMSPDGTGTREIKPFEIRMIGTPVVKKNDVVIDKKSDKRYYVDDVKVVAELRRIPLIQMLSVREAPVSDVIYKL